MLDTIDIGRALFHVVIPVEKHVVKKNGKRAFNGYVIASREALQAENHLVQVLQLYRNKNGPHKPIRHLLHAVFRFKYRDFYTKRGFARENFPDTSNLIELPQDCLTKAQIIEDDRLICRHDGCDILPSEQTELEIILFDLKTYFPNHPRLKRDPKKFPI